MFNEVNLLAMLPYDMRAAMLKNIAKDAIRKVPFLKGIEDMERVGHIFVRLQPNFFDSDEMIFRQRELGDEMFFVEKGSVLLERMRHLDKPLFHHPHHAHGSYNAGATHLHDKSVVSPWPFREEPYAKALREIWPHLSGSSQQEEDRVVVGGETFGELCLYPHLCKFRYENAKVLEDLWCLSLTRIALAEISALYPGFAKTLHDFCQMLAASVGVTNAHFETQEHSLVTQRPRGLSVIEKSVHEQKAQLLMIYEKGLASLAVPRPPLPDSFSPRPTAARSDKALQRTGVFRCWLKDEEAAKMELSRKLAHDDHHHHAPAHTFNGRPGVQRTHSLHAHAHRTRTHTHKHTHTAPLVVQHRGHARGRANGKDERSRTRCRHGARRCGCHGTAPAPRLLACRHQPEQEESSQACARPRTRRAQGGASYGRRRWNGQAA